MSIRTILPALSVLATAVWAGSIGRAQLASTEAPRGTKSGLIYQPDVGSIWDPTVPGGLPVHYEIVHYGTNPRHLSQTGRNPIRLNPYHSSTLFRVKLYDLPPKTIYYYT